MIRSDPIPQWTTPIPSTLQSQLFIEEEQGERERRVSMILECSNGDRWCRWKESMGLLWIWMIGIGLGLGVMIFLIYLCLFHGESSRVKISLEKLFHRNRSKGMNSSSSLQCQDEEQKKILLEKNHFNEISYSLNQFSIEKYPFKQGRFSKIYRAKSDELNDIVLKVLEDYSANDQIYSLFHHEKEIYSLPQMNHENVLK